jgi:hypothetical protein
MNTKRSSAVSNPSRSRTHLDLAKSVANEMRARRRGNRDARAIAQARRDRRVTDSLLSTYRLAWQHGGSA